MNVSNRTLASISAAACLFAVFGMAMAQAQQANPNPVLVGQLTNQLNITPQQAVGGAGAIFGLAKTKLNPAEFSKIASAVPGMGGFLKAAPATSEAMTGGGKSAMGSAMGSATGSLGSMIPGKAGGLASLAGSFQSLGLSPGMASQFVPVLQNYIGSKGGAKTASLFAGALK